MIFKFQDLQILGGDTAICIHLHIIYSYFKSYTGRAKD